ncbi:YoaK family protein [Streptomyces sp. NPDC012888]|uniref:YoaK family protein n=1 Tax=Streptomyces sp. NPDC012888 TaxID=3364855 RepID=UPI00369CDD2F
MRGTGKRAPAGPAGALPLLMAVLTLNVGLIEAVSFLALGPVFTGMQTGNVLFLAFGTVGAGGLSVVAPATSVAAFVVGAVTAARLEGWLEQRGHRWFIAGMLVEAALLAVAACVARGLEPVHSAPTGRHLATIAVLSGAMGLRNVTAMRVSVPDMPTTLVTRAMTAFLGGSLLGHDAAFGHGPGATARRSASVLTMFAGGLAGAAWLHGGRPPAALLLCSAGVVLLVATASVRLPRLHSH